MRIWLVLLVACGKAGPSEDVLAKSKARFEKMNAAFDANVPACTDKPKRDTVAMFHRVDFLYGLGRTRTDEPNAYWGHSNDLGSRFANQFNPESSQIEYAAAVAKLPVIAIKVTKIEPAKIESSGFTPGTIEARAVRFDLAGTPICAVTITAQNSDKVYAQASGGHVPGLESFSTDEQNRKALDDDLGSKFDSAIEDALF